MKEAFFIGFSLFTILCAIGVVFARNPIYSAFALILSFFGLSGVYLLWGSPFMAMIQILIYAGAIVVLFVFVVMLLDLGRVPTAQWQNWVTAGVAGSAIWFLSFLLLRTLNSGAQGVILSGPPQTSMREISKLLFTTYLWPFEVLSLFLLALIIAIYALARPEEAETGGHS